MRILLHAMFVTAAIEFSLAMLATFAYLLGRSGRDVAFACTRAPLLDVAVSVFTWLPWLIGYVVGGKAAALGTVFGEVIALYGWVAVHEAVNRPAVAGPRIVKFINRLVGRWRNHTALWVSVLALPGFLMIRFVEVAVYPVLSALLKFPMYNNAEWVTVSRQKFSGLVGHDLIWCLYCDWMTGVYALGGEMLRNVESFWCPIRFYDGKKCDNCKMEFPDINGGWVPADGTMAQVDHTLQTMYGSGGEAAWFGHPVRLTVHQKSV